MTQSLLRLADDCFFPIYYLNIWLPLVIHLASWIVSEDFPFNDGEKFSDWTLFNYFIKLFNLQI